MLHLFDKIFNTLMITMFHKQLQTQVKEVKYKKSKQRNKKPWQK